MIHSAANAQTGDAARRHTGARLCIFVVVALVAGRSLEAHIFIPKARRAGAYPSYPGTGWVGEAYLKLPDSAVVNMITAENYIAGRSPDFTFKTDWIDFPAGPDASAQDADLATVGELLDGHILDVSAPDMLDAPMDHLVLRFTALLKVVIEDEVRIRDIYGMPIWVEFGAFGYDGYNLRVGDEICFEQPDTNQSGPWFNFGPALQAQGLFPIVVTYFNRYDPTGAQGAPNVGLELYSWHGGGLALPAGQNMVHVVRGPGTLVPPPVLYQPGDELPVPVGDYDADGDVDFADVRWFQNCYYPPNGFIILPDGCETFDLAPDNDVDRDDWADFLPLLSTLSP